ncbi:MAG TPA: hypothetical protein VHQ47_02140 [Phycisphaerae bacterium]|nr:hypothetical protein [Phycisphaerae bacterium]
MHLITIPSMPLGQSVPPPWDDSPGAAPATATPGTTGGGTHTLTFSDFTNGLRDYNTGKDKSSTGSGVLIGVVAVVVFAGILLHVRQRRKEAGPPDSDRRLAWELLSAAGVSWKIRLLLLWVARSTGWPVAALLISTAAFDKAVGEWGKRSTFGPARRWGKAALQGARSELFA